jgi:hypothetical protein
VGSLMTADTLQLLIVLPAVKWKATKQLSNTRKWSS